jgi:hypothetical protein
MILVVSLFLGCGDNKQNKAEQLLAKATQLFEAGRCEEALSTIDSLRKVYPNAIDVRKRALRLHQNIELKQAQDELTVLDSVLQAVNHDYNYQKMKVEKDKAALQATPEELTMLTKTRVRRDSIQTRHDVLCAKIRYLHKKMKD